MNFCILILYNITSKDTTTMYETTTNRGYEYEESLEVQQESGVLKEHQGNTRIRNDESKKKQKNTNSAGKVRK